MDLGFISDLLRQSVFQIMLMAGPVLLIGMTVGLIVSIFQATTSIQEQTLTFVPKIAAILITLAIFGPWIGNQMKEFTLEIFAKIPEITY